MVAFWFWFLSFTTLL
uniref:Uncharacterized protein n=1 Tax=Arundo donax TaxID=35708 RepID=A0A0A9A7P1_ARUDO